MSYWLVKSESEVYSIDQLRADKSTLWEGVRNYQARNYLQAMQPGDLVLFYHSNSDPLAVVGLAEVAKAAVPDPLQFDPRSEYFDSGASRDKPRWFAPMLRFKSKFPVPVVRERLLQTAATKTMTLLQKGSRLSVQPVQEREFKAVLKLAEYK